MKKETEKVYKTILNLLKKNKDITTFDIDNMINKAENHLFGLDLVEKYGLKLDPKRINNKRWQELKTNVFIGFYDGVNRKISWSDCGKQPKNEHLLCFKYPTGAYIFGDDYPTEFFQKFFLELKSYNPKFIDSHNSCLYFSLDNARNVFNDYDSIIKRYYEENKENLKQRKINKMRKELTKLEETK